MKKNKGFTILELMIVIAIIAILLAIGLGMYAKSKESRDKLEDALTPKTTITETHDPNKLEKLE